MQSNLKILCVDDAAGLIEALGIALKSKNENFNFLYASNKNAAIQSLKENPDISLMILDLNLVTENGLDLVEGFRLINPSIKILIFTIDNSPVSMERAVNLKVQGYITKDSELDGIKNAILEIVNGGTYFNKQSELIKNTLSSTVKLESSEDETLRTFALYKKISKKEQDIVKLLLENKSPKEIADILGKSERTIENQKSSIYKKLEVKTFIEFFGKVKILGIV